MITTPKPKQKFIAIIKPSDHSGRRAGRRLYDENGDPFVCSKATKDVVRAFDGLIDHYRGKKVPCERIFRHELFRFELVK